MEPSSDDTGFMGFMKGLQKVLGQQDKTEYGSVLPIQRHGVPFADAGTTSVALPDMIRQPLLSATRVAEAFADPKKIDTNPNIMPDLMNVILMAMPEGMASMAATKGEAAAAPALGNVVKGSRPGIPSFRNAYRQDDEFQAELDRLTTDGIRASEQDILAKQGRGTKLPKSMGGQAEEDRIDNRGNIIDRGPNQDDYAKGRVFDEPTNNIKDLNGYVEALRYGYPRHTAMEYLDNGVGTQGAGHWMDRPSLSLNDLMNLLKEMPKSGKKNAD